MNLFLPLHRGTVGSGFRRMHDRMIDHGLEQPRLATDTGYFQVIFSRPGDDLKRLRVPAGQIGKTVPPSVEAQLNKRQRKMAALLVKGEELTSQKCKRLFAVTRDTASRDFARLIEPLAMHSGAAKAASAKPTRSLFKLPNLKRAAIRAAIVIFATVAAAHTASALTATVTAPNGGQTFTAGNTAIITWTLGGATTGLNYQKVAYSTDGGTTFTDIGPTAVFTPSDCSASWSIPSSLNSTQVRVRVRALDINANILAQDISDANFTVTPAVTLPTVTVNSPNGGENWTAGNTYSVAWTISGNTANINYQLVALSTDGGSTYNNISSALTPGSRSFSWTIPSGTSSSQVRIRVRALDINANILAQDASDNNSTISPPVIAPSLTVSAPNGGESLTGGNTYTVTWGISGSTAQINYQLVAYSTDGGSTYANISSALTPGSRSFSWTLPTGVNSSQVRVRVRALDSNANILTQDASDNNFTIGQPVVPPSLTVSTPNGSESLTGGNTYTVTWGISGNTAQINYQLVAYSTDGGSTYVNISSALTPGSRSFSWTLPSSVNSSQVRVRVRALDINANILTQDASDNNFTISQPVVPPSLTVSAPNGGESLTGGNTFTVTWGISGDTAQINYQLVALSTDGGSTYNNISSALTPGSRSFSWTIPTGTSSSITANFTRRPRLSLQDCAPTLSEEGFRLILTGELGGRFLIEGSPDFKNWTPLGTITNLLGTVQFTDRPTTNRSEFYRAMTLP